MAEELATNLWEVALGGKIVRNLHPIDLRGFRKHIRQTRNVKRAR
jgi:hypothetical protein